MTLTATESCYVMALFGSISDITLLSQTLSGNRGQLSQWEYSSFGTSGLSGIS